MKNTESYTKISKWLAEPIEKLYKTGGLALVFVFIGLLLTVYGFIFPENKFSIPMFGIGSLFILTSFILFSITHYQGPIKTRKTLKKSADTLDTLQEISIKLARFTAYIQAYSYKNLDKIKNTVNASLPLIKPFLGKKGQDFALKIENITTGIVDFSSKAEGVIRNVEKALVENDFKVLKAYEKDITSLNDQMKLALKS